MILSHKINIISSPIYQQFLIDYTSAVKYYIDYLWNNRIISTYKDKNNQENTKIFDISHLQFDLPTFYPNINYESDLSERALKCAKSQALGIIRSKIEKLRKMRHQLRKLNRENKPCKSLQRKYDKLCRKLKIPKIKSLVHAELCAMCCKYENNSIILSSIGKKYGKIKILLKNVYHLDGNLMTSFLCGKYSIDFRYEYKIEKKIIGNIEGADQGIKKCLTLSDGQYTKKDKHGNDLDLIIKKLSRKKKGSKSFKKCQKQRTNYINWCIKQLDFTNIKELNLEKLRNVSKGKRNSRYLQGFVYREILKAVDKKCNLEGIKLNEVDNVYKSQRCNICGWVHKRSRKGSMFNCSSCGYHNDADINSALNQRDNLFVLPYGVWHHKINIKGFYWLCSGIYDCDGEELSVPHGKKV